MEKVNIQEAKTHLSRYAKKVKNGQTVILCDRNKPIAEIRPIGQPEPLAPNYPTSSPKQLIIQESMDTATETYHVPTRNHCTVQDSQLLERLKNAASRSGIPMDQLAKKAIQVGLSHLLSPTTATPYQTQAQPMGLNAPYSYDNISELLAQADGEDYK